VAGCPGSSLFLLSTDRISLLLLKIVFVTRGWLRGQWWRAGGEWFAQELKDKRKQITSKTRGRGSFSIFTFFVMSLLLLGNEESVAVWRLLRGEKWRDRIVER
jgi:hypothetical protein